MRRALAEQAGLSESFSSLLRMMAIGCLARLGGDLCRDMGETSLATRLELCGRVEILLLCLPLVEELCILAAGVLS